jgi:hypothetical protein
MRALLGRHDVRRERPTSVETPQCSVDGRVADVGQTGGTQAADDVVAVPVFFGHDREDRGVERPAEKLAPHHICAGYYYAQRSSQFGLELVSESACVRAEGHAENLFAVALR